MVAAHRTSDSVSQGWVIPVQWLRHGLAKWCGPWLSSEMRMHNSDENEKSKNSTR